MEVIINYKVTTLNKQKPHKCIMHMHYDYTLHTSCTKVMLILFILLHSPIHPLLPYHFHLHCRRVHHQALHGFVFLLWCIVFLLCMVLEVVIIILANLSYLPNDTVRLR